MAKVVWAKSWPDPSKAELVVCHLDGQVAVLGNRVIASYPLDPSHAGYTLDHLKTMECYALPASFHQTIDHVADVNIAATKTLPDAAPKALPT